MPAAKKPKSEIKRLNALLELDILDTKSEEVFDDIVTDAAAACGKPIALISLVDENRQWFKARYGLEDATETSRDAAFCAHAILEEGIFQIEDATKDPRFIDNPLVLDDPNIRFYAGVPLTLSNGHNVGTLCVIDSKPGSLSTKQQAELKALAESTTKALEHRKSRQFHIKKEQLASNALAVVEQSLDPIISLDLKGHIVHWSPAAARLFGYTQNKALHQHVSIIIPDDHADEEQNIRNLLNSQKLGYEYNTVRCHKNGHRIDVNINILPVFDEKNQLVGATKIVKDRTKDLETLKKISANEAKFRALTESSPLGVFSTDVKADDIVGTTEAWRGFYSKPRPCLADLIVDQHKDQAEKFYPVQGESALTKSGWHAESWFDHLGGKRRYAIFDAAPIYDTSGEIVAAIETLQDVTEQQEVAQALEAKERLLNRTGEVAGVGGWEYDLINNKLTWSDETCMIHKVPVGYLPTVEEALDFYPADARKVIQEAIDNAISTGQPWDLEMPFIQKDGTKIWVRAVGTAERKEGETVKLYGALQNINQLVEQRHSIEESNLRVNLATHSGHIGIWDWTINNDEVIWDDFMYKLFGLAPQIQPITYDVWINFIHLDDVKGFKKLLKHFIGQDKELDTEYRVIWPDQSIHHIRITAQKKVNAHGKLMNVVGACWDVTEMRELANALSEKNEYMNVTMQSIADGVITTDANGIVTWLNPVAERLTGWLKSEAVGKPIEQVFIIIDRSVEIQAKHPVFICLNNDGIANHSENMSLISRDSIEYGIEDSIAPIRNNENQILGTVVVFRDVTEKRKITEEIEYKATHDSLTNLVNRGEFESRLTRVLEKSRTNLSSNALMLIDLDQFKLVNDACGHSAGDQLLIEVSKIFSNIIRKRDTLARLGGDEFAIILEKCPVDQAQKVAQKICDSINEFRFIYDNQRYRVGASIGLIPLDQRWTSISQAIQTADACCYAAKHEGRNRVHQWLEPDTIIKQRQGDMRWATRIQQAIEQDQFTLYAQRFEQTKGKNQKLYAEILLRLKDDDGSIITPNVFIPAAERYHLISRLDLWVVKNTIDWVTSIQSKTNIGMININISGDSVSDRAFHQSIHKLLSNTDISTRQLLCFEITETAAISQLSDASEFINHLHALGIKVALDDFGAGASSFGYLKSMKVDILKIDGQFIKTICTDKLNDSAVRCFIDIAQILNITTIAEFVETQESLDHITKLGVDYGQGYLIHKPCPVNEILHQASINNEANSA